MMSSHMHYNTMNWFKKMSQLSDLKINMEHSGGYNGQDNYIIYAQIENTPVGYIEFSIYNNQIFISIIEVSKDYRRKGVATDLLRYMQEQFPDSPVNPGYSSEEGFKFYSSIPKKSVKNERYTELIEEKSQLKDRLQAISAIWSNPVALNLLTEAEKDGLSENDRRLEDRLNQIEIEIERTPQFFSYIDIGNNNDS